MEPLRAWFTTSISPSASMSASIGPTTVVLPPPISICFTNGWPPRTALTNSRMSATWLGLGLGVSAPWLGLGLGMSAPCTSGSTRLGSRLGLALGLGLGLGTDPPRSTRLCTTEQEEARVTTAPAHLRPRLPPRCAASAVAAAAVLPRGDVLPARGAARPGSAAGGRGRRRIPQPHRPPAARRPPWAARCSRPSRPRASVRPRLAWPTRLACMSATERSSSSAPPPRSGTG